jgi:hypothetical protein
MQRKKQSRQQEEMEMKYKYRIIYTGERNRTLRDGTVEHSEFKNQPCSWCKTAENAEKKFISGIEGLRKMGAEVIISEYHIEAKQY